MYGNVPAGLGLIAAGLASNFAGGFMGASSPTSSSQGMTYNPNWETANVTIGFDEMDITMKKIGKRNNFR
jgi:hypothetical protein